LKKILFSKFSNRLFKQLATYEKKHEDKEKTKRIEEAKRVYAEKIERLKKEHEEKNKDK